MPTGQHLIERMKGDGVLKIAVITGASSGLGREFVRQLEDFFPDIESYWLIARRGDLLEESAEELMDRHVECMALDLCDPMSFAVIQGRLAAEKPKLSLLINCAGCGQLGLLGQVDTASQTRMVDLNVRAMTALTNIAIPFMPAGSRILNVSSIAAFCPTARMTVYSSTKAYISSFSLGLREELRRKGISVTAVCPGPMPTGFLDKAGVTGQSRTFEFLPYCDQVRVAAGALRAARAGSAMYTPKLFYKFYRCLAKITPAKWTVRLSKV